MSATGDADDTIEFTRDGRTVRARAGQSIAAALHAHGDRVLSRSTKYHRPRGWACGTGDCANCTMRVDGVPNVRTCIEEARPGQRVEGQNAWPNVRHDLLRANDYAFRKGIDHHRGFVRPRVLYPLFGAVIRAFAGWGRVPEPPSGEPKTETRRVDLVVVGAGPAGLAAASAAGEAGAQVLLIERSRQTGGVAALLRREMPDPEREPPASGTPIPAEELTARWREEARATGRVIIQTGSSLNALYPNGIHLIRSGNTLLLAKAPSTVFTTGTLSNEGSFEGNDLPGVMSATGCLALLNREGVRPGRRAVVHGAGAHGLATALELHEAGVQVVQITEAAPKSPAPRTLLEQAKNQGLTVSTDTEIVRTHGWNRLRALTVKTPHGKRRLQADLLVVAQGTKTLPFALQGLGARLTHDPHRGGTLPVLDPELMTSVPGLYVAGDAAGVGSLSTARASGRLAGMAAAARLGFIHNEWSTEKMRLTRRLQEAGIGAGAASAQEPATIATTNRAPQEQNEVLR